MDGLDSDDDDVLHLDGRIMLGANPSAVHVGGAEENVDGDSSDEDENVLSRESHNTFCERVRAEVHHKATDAVTTIEAFGNHLSDLWLGSKGFRVYRGTSPPEGWYFHVRRIIENTRFSPQLAQALIRELSFRWNTSKCVRIDRLPRAYAEGR